MLMYKGDIGRQEGQVDHDPTTSASMIGRSDKVATERTRGLQYANIAGRALENDYLVMTVYS